MYVRYIWWGAKRKAIAQDDENETLNMASDAVNQSAMCGLPRATDNGSLLTTERSFWHCGAHTAEPKTSAQSGRFRRFRIRKKLLFSVARRPATLLTARLVEPCLDQFSRCVPRVCF